MNDEQNQEQELWTEGDVRHGYREVTLHTWRAFGPYVDRMSSGSRHFIYRGQADHDWELIPKLDRLLQDLPESDQKDLRRSHLNQFKLAIRGKRGPNPPELTDDNDWWCLGQHHGLATPLLDWTEAPFVALYFAFLEEMDQSVSACSIYAMDGQMVGMHSDCTMLTHDLSDNARRAEILDNNPGDLMGFEFGKEDRKPAIVAILQPATDENHRLVSQRALLTGGNKGRNVEDWIQTSFPDLELPLLTKISIPNDDREACLKSLNLMNINHMSLFPDLAGACEYCNVALSMKYNY